MKKSKSFKIGDKVFAKVKGYPPWPALVESENGKKYNVKFYGTGEIGNIKADDLFYFIKNKKQLMKPLKRKDYNDALEEIEKAIKEDGGDGDINPDDSNDSILNGSTDLDKSDTKTLEPKKGKRKRTDSDANQNANKKQQSAVENSLIESENDKEDKKLGKEEDKLEKGEEKLDKEEDKLDKKEEKLDKEEKKLDRKEEVDKEKTLVQEDSQNEGEAEKPKDSPATDEKMDENKDKMDTNDEANKPTIQSPAKKKESTVTEKSDDSDQNKSQEAKAKEVIISKKCLENCILYAEHVKSDEQYYKDQPPELPLIAYENTILPVKLPSGKYVGIKLNCLPVPKFDTEYSRAIFDEKLAKKVLEEKDKLIGAPDNLDEQFIVPDMDLTDEKIQQYFTDRDLQNKQKRVNRLKDESKLVELDSKIKLCLGLDTADPLRALEYLDEILNVNIDCLMLLKHFHLPEMVKRLRIYVGNTKEWNLSEESLEQFKNNAQKVREKADDVYKSFKTLFPPSASKQYKTFWEGFTVSVNAFREECKNLSDAEICVLCAPPKSRQTFMDQLEEKEILQNNQVDNRGDSKETEKENSSEVANSEKVVEGTAQEVS